MCATSLPRREQANPERLLHKRFSIRPRTAGLWLRMTLTDGEELEGLAANDRALVEGAGLLLTPPDTRSNTQRIYVPRQAIQTLEVVSLIGAAGRKRSRGCRGERQSSRSCFRRGPLGSDHGGFRIPSWCTAATAVIPVQFLP